MPNCGYLKDYSVKVEQSRFQVSLTPAGEIDVCNIIVNAFPRAKCVVLEKKMGFLHIKQTIAISGLLPRHEELDQFLSLLSNHLTINDTLDECHALALRSLPPIEGAGDWRRTKIGELVYRAKYRQNRTSANQVADYLTKFIRAHPRYRRAEFITAAPRSLTNDAFDLPGEMVRQIAAKPGKSVAIAQKTRQTSPHKELWKQGDTQLLKANVKDSIRLQISLLGHTVIVVDDTYGSGATLEELGHACRAVGATEVLGLTPTKNAKFTYGIELTEVPSQ